VQTMPHTELFLRSSRVEPTSATPFYLPSPPRPYWFEELDAS